MRVARAPATTLEDIVAGRSHREVHRLGEHPLRLIDAVAIGMDAVEPEQRVLGRDPLRAGAQRPVLSGDDGHLQAQALRVSERQRLLAGRRVDLDALAGQAPGPESERVVGADTLAWAVDHPVSRPAVCRTRELEEGQDRAGRAALIAVGEVVDVGCVEVGPSS
jgi:hypothetical protein